MSVKIASVEVNTFTKKEVLSKIKKAIKNYEIMQIVTPYSEFIVEAEYNLPFREAINKSEIKVPDGIGILWAGAYLANKWDNIIISLLGILNRDIKLYSIFPEKISGSDLIYDVLEIANDNKNRIYLLGGEGKTPLKVKDYISKNYPRITITDMYSKKVNLEDYSLFKKILDTQSDIVLVALSYPKQEIFASQLKQYFIENDHRGVILCVGGTFDFLAGIQNRAPKWMQSFGIEWLYRLTQQPSRINRIYKAIVRFTLLIETYKRKRTKL